MGAYEAFLKLRELYPNSIQKNTMYVPSRKRRKPDSDSSGSGDSSERKIHKPEKKFKVYGC